MLTLPATRPWFEGDDWQAVAAARGLTARERALVDTFRSEGFVVVEDTRVLDELDVEGIWTALAGRFKPAGAGRVQDAWRELPAVRAIAAHPAVLAVLRLLYGREPIPFQTLTFLNGTEQRTHSDTIHFSSLPSGFMCGVWMALEDVALRQGPLHYFPTSQRLPEFDYDDLGVPPVAGERTWDNPRTLDSYLLYEKRIDALARENGFRREELAIAKGTFLVWSANLLHGGSPRDDRTLTRKSQVSHYYFADSVPFTPMFSHRAEGRYDVRRLQDVRTGRWITPSLDGVPVLFPGRPDGLRAIAPAGGLAAVVTKAIGVDRGLPRSSSEALAWGARALAERLRR